MLNESRPVTDAPIFVVGAMGSGTTVLRLILDSHENIAIAQETGFARLLLANRFIPFWRWGGDWYGRLGIDDAELDEHLRRFYGGLFADFAARRGASRWGDKTPFHVWHMEMLGRIWPDAVFVGITRHPGALASSVNNRFHYGWHGSVRHWVRSNFQMAVAGAALGERFALCRYEDVITDPEPQMRDLFDWLGEPWSDRVLNYQQVQAERGVSGVVEGRTRVSDPLDTSRITKWVNDITEEGRRELRRQASGLAAYFGYDIDDPLAIDPLPPGAGRTVLPDGVVLGERRAQFADVVDWTRRPKPTMENRLMKPAALKALKQRGGNGKQAASTNGSERAAGTSDADSIKARSASLARDLAKTAIDRLPPAAERSARELVARARRKRG